MEPRDDTLFSKRDKFIAPSWRGTRDNLSVHGRGKPDYTSTTSHAPYVGAPFGSASNYQNTFDTSGKTLHYASSQHPVTLVSIDSYFLNRPLEVFVEYDFDGYIARSPEFPLYGYGESQFEALAMLKREIVSMYQDLSEDDDLPTHLQVLKKALQIYLG